MTEKKTRRRGQVLEEAILDAAWEEVIVVGYQHFTVEGVVKRAKTSRSVVYRRWNNRVELFEAALLRYFRNNLPIVPDTGSMRTDLIDVLGQIAEKRANLMIFFLTQMADYYRETDSKPVDLKQKILQGGISVLDQIIANAVARGEISDQPIPDLIKHLPFDMLRNEVHMNFEPPSKDKIYEIVDLVFMPLVRLNQAADRVRHGERRLSVSH